MGFLKAISIENGRFEPHDLARKLSGFIRRGIAQRGFGFAYTF